MYRECQERGTTVRIPTAICKNSGGSVIVRVFILASRVGDLVKNWCNCEH